MQSDGWSLRDLYRTLETPGANHLHDPRTGPGCADPADSATNQIMPNPRLSKPQPDFQSHPASGALVLLVGFVAPGVVGFITGIPARRVLLLNCNMGEALVANTLAQLSCPHVLPAATQVTNKGYVGNTPVTIGR
jgi:hypothetical protein